MGLTDFQKPETIVAMCAFVVAFSALFISIWQAVLSRRHNRLSIQPHLRVDRPIGEIVLSSTGLGPARIRAISFCVDDEEYPGDGICSLARAFEKLNLVGSGVVARIPRSGDTLRAGEEHVLLSFNDFDRESDRGKHILNALARIGLHIEFESLYGDIVDVWESDTYHGR